MYVVTTRLFGLPLNNVHSPCRSVLRIRDVYPGSWFLPIPDPGFKKSNKSEWMKKNLLYHFCNHKFHKIENYIIFEMLKKIIWANFQRIKELFTQKIVYKLSKICVWDPGSRIQGSKRHRIPDPDPHNCFGYGICYVLRAFQYGIRWNCGSVLYPIPTFHYFAGTSSWWSWTWCSAGSWVRPASSTSGPTSSDTSSLAPQR